DPNATLPADYKFTAADAGVHTFNATFTTAGTQTLTVNDKRTTSVTASADVVVSPAAAFKLGFAVQPVSTIVFMPISPAVEVQVFDRYGNLETTDNGRFVRVRLGSNPTGATLSGTLIRPDASGDVAFNNLSLNKRGTGYTLVAT